MKKKREATGILGVIWGYIGIMEHKMETAFLGA